MKKLLFFCFGFAIAAVIAFRFNLALLILQVIPQAKTICIKHKCEKLPEGWYVYNNKNLIYGIIPDFMYPKKSLVDNNGLMSGKHFIYTLINPKLDMSLYLHEYDLPVQTPKSIISGFCRYGNLSDKNDNATFFMFDERVNSFVDIHPVNKNKVKKLPPDIEYTLCELFR